MGKIIIERENSKENSKKEEFFFGQDFKIVSMTDTNGKDLKVIGTGTDIIGLEFIPNGDILPPDAVEYVCSAFGNQRKIKRLALNLGEMNGTDAKIIANFLKDKKSLTEFNLSGNEIDADGAKYLTEGLKDNESLKELDISGNKIGDDGAKYLTEGLKDNESLTTLNLSDNKIGVDGVKYIAESLKNNKSLTGLDFWGNRIKNKEWVKKIDERIKKNMENSYEKEQIEQPVEQAENKFGQDNKNLINKTPKGFFLSSNQNKIKIDINNQSKVNFSENDEGKKNNEEKKMGFN